MDDIKKPEVATVRTSSKSMEPLKTPGKKISTKSKRSRSRISKVLFMLLALVLVALAAGSFVLYGKYQATQQQVEKLSTVQGQQELNQTQVNQLLGEMRAIILLPKDEDPVVATISDMNLLKDKDFYKDAQNGDRVVVFANAKKAYIYRPSNKMIINVGAFEVSTGQTTQSQ